MKKLFVITLRILFNLCRYVDDVICEAISEKDSFDFFSRPGFVELRVEKALTWDGEKLAEIKD